MENLEPGNLKALVGVLKWYISINEKQSVCTMAKQVKERASGTKIIHVDMKAVSKLICHDINCQNDSRFAKEYVPRILQYAKKQFSCPEQ